MWVPKTVDELERTVQAGSIEESEIFDAKKELSTKSTEIAKDIAAMATEGGVLIYGIGEDEHGRPTLLNPIPLAGQRERINSIVQSGIAEPPRIMISTLPTKIDPALGYIVIEVPPSERAPHMVIVKGDHRFYGRTATGNIPLTESHVALLYERRRRWEVDRNALLSREIQNAPLAPRDDFGYLYVFARPVAQQDELLDQAARPDKPILGVLPELSRKVSVAQVYPRQYAPDFALWNDWSYTATGFLCKLDRPSVPNNPREPASTLNMQIDQDGTGHLFCGRAAERTDKANFLLMPVVAGNTTRFLAFLGLLYEQARYVGMVDIGVAITGIKGAVPTVPQNRRMWPDMFSPYTVDEYRRTARTIASDLSTDPRAIAKKLLNPLFIAVAQGHLDPFDDNYFR